MSKRFSVVGQSLPKIDAWAKVAGETRYADDLKLARMAHGKLLRSPHPHARIVGIDTARARALHVSVDPKESHIDAYRGVGILTPNQYEAGGVMGRRIVDEASLMEVGWGLQKRLDASAVLVTRGPDGMSLFEKSGRYTHLPTVAREV